MHATTEPVLVLAPLGRDAEVIVQALGSADMLAIACCEMATVAARMHANSSIVILTEEALTEGGVRLLIRALSDQPSWSEIPILLLLSSRGEQLRPGPQQLVSTVRVTVLQRPVPTVTLVTTSRTLLSARRRQHDVRELIERERAERERAERATRVKDEFLATVSHELRTPLSAILLWSNLLERNQLSPEQAREAVTAIKRSAEAQTQLIEDLLDLSRMMMGKLRLTIGIHNISELVKAAVEVVTPMADAKHVRLLLDLCPALDVPIDADRIQQIVWNLLGNAVKFTPAGGEVRISARQENESVVLEVTDNGVGIEPEVMRNVFERFQQGDSSAGRRHAGLGIGLPIVKELVQLHGGTVDVHSEGSGRGSAFVIRLPMAQPGAPTVSRTR